MKQISSRDNPFYRELVKIAGAAKHRNQASSTLLDGTHLLDACLNSGTHPKHILLHADFQQHAEISNLLLRCPEVPVTVLDASLFAALSELKSPSGVLALLSIPQYKFDSTQSKFCLLLENIQDPGNVGSMLRTAAAAGCDSVFLSSGCADAWSPRVLRAAMGGHFSLKIHEYADLVNVTEIFRGKVYAASLSAKRTLFDCPMMGNVAIAVGNEGAGLSDELLNRCEPFIIPMPGAVESLNAAAAAAICLFEAVRQRNLKPY